MRKYNTKGAARARIAARRHPDNVLPGTPKPQPSRADRQARAESVARAFQPWAGARGIDRTARMALGN